MTEVDDRTRPLLLAQAAKRGAEDWRHEDAEAVIAHLLAENDRLAASPEVAKLVAEAEARGMERVAERITETDAMMFTLADVVTFIRAEAAAMRRAAEEAGI